MLLFLLALRLAFAAPPPLGPVPDWVVPSEVDLGVSEPQGAVRPSSQYLLVDNQALLEEGGAVGLYQERVFRIVTAEALDELSRIEVEYDAASARVEMHRLEVWREGAWQDRLATAEAVQIQRESDLWQHILDGRSTLVVVPEDIRVGDTVRGAWTVYEENPLFDGHAAESWSMAWSVPVAMRRLRVLYPAERPLFVGLHGEVSAPTESRLGDRIELRWDLQQVAGVEAPSGAPVDHVVWPWVQVSTYPDWAAVVDWSLQRYRLEDEPGAEVETVARELAPADASPAEVYAAAVRWVQEEVRYFGVEVGAGSFHPRPPELVLRRRYGDCKDKTLLLVALLRARGLSAWPALVNTRERSALARWLPAPNDFDHVIVAVELDGRLRFVDPTRRHQGGGVDLYVPDYGKALLVRSGETGLVDVERDSASSGSLRTRTMYTVDDEDSIDLAVNTCSEGGRAEGFRASLADTTPEQLQERYLAYYRRPDLQITPLREVQVEDDRDANRLCVSEGYRLDGGWTEEGDWYLFDLYEPELMRLLPVQEDPSRKVPLALPERLHEVDDIVIVAPSTWDLEADDASTENPWFRYTRKISRQELSDGTQVFTLRHELEVLDDQVPVEGLARYGEARREASEELGFQLSRPDLGKEERDDFGFWVGLVVMLGTMAAPALPIGLMMALAWATRKPRKA